MMMMKSKMTPTTLSEAKPVEMKKKKCKNEKIEDNHVDLMFPIDL